MVAVNYTLADLRQIAKQFHKEILRHKIVLFSGDLGVGKTTMIRELLLLSGFQDFQGSPTFALVNSYENSNLVVHHMDFYRLGTGQELANLDLVHYLASGRCWIEWGERFTELLPDNFVQLKFEYVDEQRRTCSFLTI